jgi:hypothetical protein
MFHPSQLAVITTLTTHFSTKNSASCPHSVFMFRTLFTITSKFFFKFQLIFVMEIWLIWCGNWMLMRCMLFGTPYQYLYTKMYGFCLMVEASHHGYVLHTRRIHVTRYNVVRVGYIFFWTSNYVQQRKTYTRKAATVHINCSTVPCNTLCERIAAVVPCNTLCARIAAAVWRKTCDVICHCECVWVRDLGMQYPRVRHIHVKNCICVQYTQLTKAVTSGLHSLRRSLQQWATINFYCTPSD